MNFLDYNHSIRTSIPDYDSFDEAIDISIGPLPSTASLPLPDFYERPISPVTLSDPYHRQPSWEELPSFWPTETKQESAGAAVSPRKSRQLWTEQVRQTTVVGQKHQRL